MPASAYRYTIIRSETDRRPLTSNVDRSTVGLWIDECLTGAYASMARIAIDALSVGEIWDSRGGIAVKRTR